MRGLDRDVFGVMTGLGFKVRLDEGLITTP